MPFLSRSPFAGLSFCQGPSTAMRPFRHVIADHSARPEGGTTVGKTHHQIAEQALRSEVEAARFKFVADAQFLRHPEDTRINSVFHNRHQSMSPCGNRCDGASYRPPESGRPTGRCTCLADRGTIVGDKAADLVLII